MRNVQDADELTQAAYRELRKIAASGATSTLAIPLDGSWTPGGAVVFAQRADRRIVASRLLTVR